jgi:O-acetylhomoserine/O-acetylserine sulfhydrylase-like pyridoxal-dependent enzyme
VNDCPATDWTSRGLEEAGSLYNLEEAGSLYKKMSNPISYLIFLSSKIIGFLGARD